MSEDLEKKKVEKTEETKVSDTGDSVKTETKEKTEVKEED